MVAGNGFAYPDLLASPTKYFSPGFSKETESLPFDDSQLSLIFFKKMTFLQFANLDEVDVH